MAFQVSPGVLTTEKDLTTIVPNVSTSIGAVVSPFEWGPVDERRLIGTENELKELFQTPKDDVNYYRDWLCASAFLAYSNSMIVVRGVEETDDATATPAKVSAKNSVFGGTSILIKNRDDYDNTTLNNQLFIAKYPGKKYGDSLKVILCDTIEFNKPTNTSPETKLFQDNFDSAPGTSDYVRNLGGYNDEVHVLVIDEGGVWTNNPGEVLEKYAFVSFAGDAKTDQGGTNYFKEVINDQSKYVWIGDVSGISAEAGNTASGTNFGQSNDDAEFTNVSIGTGVDVNKLSISSGAFPTEAIMQAARVTVYNPATGESTVVEVASRADDTNIILTAGHGIAAGTTGLVIDFLSPVGQALTTNIIGGSLSDGKDGSNFDNRSNTWLKHFQNDEEVDVNFLILGNADKTTAKFVLQNIAEVRQDCIACISPEEGDVVNAANEQSSLKSFSTFIGSSSYAIVDSAWKYVLDRYNDKFRWVQMNGDIAGLMARTDVTDDPWFSPAGFNRGGIKNALKLSWSQGKADRDAIYKIGINPIVNFPVQGITLYGDKTKLAKPSAFDRINVRRLFIVLRKAIARAAKFSLFELNDEFTRAQFKSLVEPFLRTVQGRRGVTDFKVVCDSSNNTGDIIDRNEFVADIYIKPARSINFIQLNFIATRTDVSFEEVGG